MCRFWYIANRKLKFWTFRKYIRVWYKFISSMANLQKLMDESHAKQVGYTSLCCDLVWPRVPCLPRVCHGFMRQVINRDDWSQHGYCTEISFSTQLIEHKKTLVKANHSQVTHEFSKLHCLQINLFEKFNKISYILINSVLYWIIKERYFVRVYSNYQIKYLKTKTLII